MGFFGWLQFKLEHGSDALDELFDDHEVTEIVDVGRASVVASPT